MSIVLKFGGSSLTIDGFKLIKNKISELKDYKIIIVLSAINKTTNNLINFSNDHFKLLEEIRIEHLNIIQKLKINPDLFIDDYKKLLDLYNRKDKDDYLDKVNIISYGEILSTKILSEYLKLNKINNELIDAKDIIFTDNNYNNMSFTKFKMKGSFSCNLNKLNKNDCNVKITQGFIASTKNSYPCLLSRGGSDTTASLIAAGIKAIRLEIWTDVDGLFSCDPNIIKNAKLIKETNYKICQSISALGAKVLHPYCIKPCKEKNIPIYIKNSKNPNNNKYTLINNKYNNKYNNKDNNNNNIFLTKRENIHLLDIRSLDMWNNYGILNDIFSKFTLYEVDVDIIVTSPFNISCTINDNKNINNLINNLINYKVKYIENLNIISIITNNIINIDITNIIIKYNNDIHIINYSSDKLSLSYVVNSNIANDFLQELHNKLIEN